jgi:hypothetical protein
MPAHAHPVSTDQAERYQCSVLQRSRAASPAQKHSDAPIAMYLKACINGQVSINQQLYYHNIHERPSIDRFNDSKGLEANKACELIIGERKTKCLEAAGGVSVNVVLGDGEVVYMGFLIHKSITTLLVAEDLVNDLGVGTEQSPMAKNIKRQGPWNTTNVKGMYVAGDAGTSISNIVTAIAHGMIWPLIGVMGLN